MIITIPKFDCEPPLNVFVKCKQIPDIRLAVIKKKTNQTLLQLRHKTLTKYKNWFIASIYLEPPCARCMSFTDPCKQPC